MKFRKFYIDVELLAISLFCQLAVYNIYFITIVGKETSYFQIGCSISCVN